MTLSETKSPGWMRAVQIVLGVIAVVGSIIALVFPAFTTLAVVYILGIVLIFTGIERILIGIFSPAPGSSRWGTIGLGIIVLIVAGIVVAYPLGSTVFILFVLAIALFCDGIARVVHSLAARSQSGGARAFGIVAGIFEIIIAILIMVSPIWGAVLAGILISIALLVVGIQIIVAGVTGGRLSVPKPTKG
jgi:uncharacterized membrane protein HdeD (DUF308 family)